MVVSDKVSPTVRVRVLEPPPPPAAPCQYKREITVEAEMKIYLQGTLRYIYYSGICVKYSVGAFDQQPLCVAT